MIKIRKFNLKRIIKEFFKKQETKWGSIKNKKKSVEQNAALNESDKIRVRVGWGGEKVGRGGEKLNV